MQRYIKYRKIESNIAGEYNDCVVGALMSSLGITYNEAYNIFKEEGRRRGKGISTEHLSELLRYIGYTLLPFCNLKISEAVEICKDGRFICRTKNHAFAVVNGTVYDFSPPTNQKIERVYKYGKDIN